MGISRENSLEERIFHRLEYCHITGKVRWRNGRNKGMIAGSSTYTRTKGLYYWQINLQGNQLRAHRVAWLLYYGKWPSKEIDHINGIGTDNRIENLRDVSRSENLCNTHRGIEERNKRILNAARHKGPRKKNRERARKFVSEYLSREGKYPTREEVRLACQIGPAVAGEILKEMKAKAA